MGDAMQLRNAVLVDGARSAFARGGRGRLVATRLDDAGAQILRALLGPVVSSKKALRNAGITADQIDRVEFNEAFAAQLIPSIRELGIPQDRVNVNGGSLAIGHPLGATGARLVTTVAMELRRSNQRYGLATQCIGAGMGISTVLERLD